MPSGTQGHCLLAPVMTESCLLIASLSDHGLASKQAHRNDMKDLRSALDLTPCPDITLTTPD